MTPTTLVDLWERQAAATPDALAVLAGDEQLTYAELDVRAAALAARLRARGVGPESLVGVCLPRSAELVVALLGVLKAGGAYVPLDPGYPAERLTYMAGHSGIRLVLCGAGQAQRPPLAGEGLEFLPVDRADDPDAQAAAPGITHAGPQNLAYVIYTSGSTGRPKGVAVTHASIASFLRSMAKEPGLAAGDRVLGLTPLSFDISTLEMFLPLTVGAATVLAPAGANTDPAALAATIEEHGVTLVQATPTTWRMLVEWGWRGGRGLTLVSGGEPLEGPLAQRLLDRGRSLWNLYGPTETTVWSAASRIVDTDPVTVGTAIDNTGLYVVDEQGRRLGPGATGELWISGIGLARGYAARPALTAERFVADPFGAPGSRAYRTGDLARLLPDGRLEVLGRADHQIKLRGFRIELGEIEEALRSHPKVAHCVVGLDEQAPGGAQLVAYTVLRGERSDHWAAELRAHAAESLPAYMVPQGYAALPALPRTPAGKTDRTALAEVRYERVRARRTTTEPASPREELILSVWRETLGIEHAEDLTPQDDFFAIGGQSIAAIRAAARLSKVFGVALEPNAVFSRPTAAEFARFLDDAGHDAAPGEPIEALGPDAQPPLSFGQERILIYERMDTGVPLYNVPVAVTFKDRPVDIGVLERSLTEIVRRHEVLRTALVSDDGPTRPEVRPAPRIRIQAVDTTEATVHEVLGAAARAPFALDSGVLLRGLLVRTGAREILLVTMHHLACDGWSVGVLMRELGTLYQDFTAGRLPSLPQPRIQYADYAHWQREQLTGDTLAERLAYWQGQLAGVQALELPLDHTRPAVASHTGERILFRIPEPLADRLREVCRAQGATLFMGLLTGLKVLLGRYAGQHDVAVGTLVGGRARPETEDLIGFFVNTVVLRTDLSGDPTFEQLIGRVREVALEAYAHQDLPFERLVEELRVPRDLSRNPLFQVLFALHDAEPEGPLAEGVSRRELEAQLRGARFDLAVDVSDLRGELEVSLEFATDLFERATAERLGRHYLRVLEQLVAHAGTGRVAALEVLDAEEREQAVEAWNTPSAPTGETTLVALWQRQAAATPDGVAVVAGEERITFAELDGRATALAALLRERGVGPESLVGICLTPSIDTVTSLLGVLKAGGAYVPLDPGYPQDRLRYMVADSGVRLVLADTATAGLPVFGGASPGDAQPADAQPGDARPAAVDTLLIDRLDLTGPPPAPVTAPAGPANLAYVIYTSGSTGRPKGVAITHANITGFLDWNQRVCRLGPQDRALQNHSVAFDNSVWEIFQCLVSGAQLHIADARTAYDPEEFLREVQRAGITTLNATPSQMRILLEKAADPATALASVRLVFTGAEAVPFDVARRILDAAGPGCRVFNEYGPTEATVTSAVCELSAALLDRHAARPSVPFGRPTDNARLYVLDGFLQPVVPGSRGMLYVGGSAVGRGYLGQPGKTAGTYVPDPFSATPGARMYTTGDIVQLLPDGNLVFLGRGDHQVKLRGFRIELGEIEEALRHHPLVSDCAVAIRRDASGGDQLAAYVVLQGAMPANLAAELREHLADRLPTFMLPGACTTLDEIPLTANGKVDRAALPEPRIGDVRTALRRPGTELEKLVAGAWAEAIGLDPADEQVGLDDNFFEVGGNSLLVAEVSGRLGRRLGRHVSPVLLFRFPTVCALAEELGRQSAVAA